MPIYTISDIRCASVSNKKEAGKLTYEKTTNDQILLNVINNKSISKERIMK